MQLNIWPKDRTLSDATTPSQSGPGSDADEEVSRITGASPSYCLVSYPGQSLGWGLPLCSDVIGVLYNPSRLANI